MYIYAPSCMLICLYMLLYMCVFMYIGVFLFEFAFCLTSLLPPVRRVTHDSKTSKFKHKIG